MKKLIVSLMTAFLIGSFSLGFAGTSPNVIPVEASVIIRTQAMKVDVITPANNESAVIIRLRDAKGNTLLKKHVSHREGLTLSRFDLSNLEDGMYKVEITNGTSKQVKAFTIETASPSLTPLRSVSLS